MKKYLFAVLPLVVIAGGAGLFFYNQMKHVEHVLETDHDDHDHEKEIPKTEQAGSSRKEPENSRKESFVHLTDAQQELIQIKLGKAVAGDVESTLNLNGEVRLNLDKTARIMPRMPGFVSRIFVKDGDSVRKGQRLATLTSHKLGEYYSNYNSALEQEKLAKSEFEMAEELKNANATSRKEYLRYKREYAEAVITRKHTEELLQSLQLDPAHAEHLHARNTDAALAVCTTYDVTAPLNGTVIARNITLGENFTEDSLPMIFTVSDLSNLWLELRASPQELLQIREGQVVIVSNPDTRQEYQGKVVYIAPVIDEQTRTGLVRVEMDNRNGGLRPGQFVAGRIQIDSAVRSVMVPRDAVQLLEGKPVVFIPQGDGFAPRQVTLGKDAGPVVQIISGLNPGEQYVSSGSFELKSILLVSGMDSHAGHGH